MSHSNFEGAAKSLLHRYASLSEKTEEALALSQKGLHEQAHKAMAEMIRMSEKATLLGRKLPLHTGYPDAKTEVDKVLSEACPVKMGFTQRDWFFLRMPPLASREDVANKEYIRGILYPALLRFWLGKPIARFPESVIVFRHVYAFDTPSNRKRDYDNVETKFVMDAIAMYLLVDDCPDQCEVFHCSAIGEEDSLDVYVVPQDDFDYWYNSGKTFVEQANHLRDKVPSCWRA